MKNTIAALINETRLLMYNDKNYRPSAAFAVEPTSFMGEALIDKHTTAISLVRQVESLIKIIEDMDHEHQDTQEDFRKLQSLMNCQAYQKAYIEATGSYISLEELSKLSIIDYMEKIQNED